MRRCLSALALAVLVTSFLARPSAQSRGELTVWTARAIATVLAEIGPQFERTTAHKLNIVSDLPPGFTRRLTLGETADVIISGGSIIDEWIASGRVISETRTGIARAGIGVEVREGAAKPDISSVEAFKRALLEAKSIAYLKVGSGLHLDRVIQSLGIADAIRTKVTRPDSDIVSELVAQGQVELGMVVIPQILTTPGVVLVGPLPAAIQSELTFVAGVGVRSRAPDLARQLIKLLTDPAAHAVMRRQGMQPAS